MKKILTLLLSLLIVLSLVGCNNKKEEETISHTHTYEVDEEGVWKCSEDNDILSNTDKPYVAVLENNEPKDIISLDSITSKKTNLGNGVIYKEDNTIFYNGNNAQTIIIKTEKDNKNNEDKVVINAPNDTVYHYGSSSVISLDAVATNSFHEYGKVDLITLTVARIVLETLSNVKEIYLDINNPNYNYESAVIAIKEEVELPSLSRDSVDLQEGEVKTLAVVQQLKDETKQDNSIETKTEEESFVKIENISKTDKDLVIQAFLSPNSDTKDNTKLETKQTSTLTLEEAKEGSSHPASKNTFASKDEKIIEVVKPQETPSKEETKKQETKKETKPVVKPTVIPKQEESKKDDPTPTPVVTKYTVTFDMQGHGTQVPSQSIEKNKKLTKPTNPTATGLIFKGWYKESTYATAWDFDTDIITSNTTLYAKWAATIAYVVGDSFTTIKSSAWKSGDDRICYYIMNGFKMLCFEKNINTLEVLSTDEVLKISNDCYTYRNVDSKFTLKFNMAEGKLASIVFDADDTAALYVKALEGTYTPPVPTTIGDILPDSFPTGHEIYNLYDGPDGKWYISGGAEKYCAIRTFDSNPNELTFMDASNTTYKYWVYDQILLSESVTQNGDNWIYTGSDSTITFKFEGGELISIVHEGTHNDGTHNGTYTAPIITYTVTFNLNGISGTAPETQTINKDGKVTKPTDPSDTIHTFDGWYKTKDATTGELSDKWDFDNDVVTENITLYAQWTRTMESILGTNTDVPKSDNTLNIPNNAWVNKDNVECKAFVSTYNQMFVLRKLNDTEHFFDIDFTTQFIKVNDNYMYEGENKKVICCMEDGMFVSAECESKEEDLMFFNGAYSAPIDEPSYTMMSGSTWFSKFENKSINKNSVADIVFTKNTPSGATCVGDLTANTSGKVNGYYVQTDDNYKIYIVGDYIYGNEDCSQMFLGFKNLTNLNLGNFDTSNVTNMLAMFYNCSNLESLDLSKFDTAKVTDMGNMFYNCSNLTSLDISKFNTTKVIKINYMFKNCSNLKTITFGNNFDTSNVSGEGMKEMFVDCSSLISLDLSKFSTSNVTSMIGMFNGCSNLKTITFGSSFDTSKVTSMEKMFNGCSKLESLDLSKFNTSNVTFMANMFNGCSSLTSLDLNGFNTSNVTGMANMFNGCSSLTSLDLNGFNTSNVSSMAFMFGGCSSLTSLDLSNFTVSKVRSLNNMFDGCSKLESLDLSGFDKADPSYIDGMFNDCSKLTFIKMNAENKKIANKLGDGWTYNGDNKVYEKISVSYTVTFDMQDHGLNIDPITNIVPGSKISAPTKPSADGYVFKGWYKEATCTNEWKFDTDIVTSNTTLYAKWVETKTIGEILNSVVGGFPTTLENGWTASNGQKCYSNDGNIYFKRSSPSRTSYDPLLTPIEKTDNGYICIYSENEYLLFNTKNDVLVSITLLFDSEDYNAALSGTYTPSPVTLKMGVKNTFEAPTNEDLIVEIEENEPVTEESALGSKQEESEVTKAEDIISPLENVIEETTTDAELESESKQEETEKEIQPEEVVKEEDAVEEESANTEASD